jgi:prevent-host-death family protein
LAFVAYLVAMDADPLELSVTEARNSFSDAVNRAVFGGEVTYVTRGRGHRRAAAIVPAALVERYEAMLDAEDGRIAQARLDDLDAGREAVVRSSDLLRELES